MGQSMLHRIVPTLTVCFWVTRSSSSIEFFFFFFARRVLCCPLQVWRSRAFAESSAFPTACSIDSALKCSLHLEANGWSGLRIWITLMSRLTGRMIQTPCRSLQVLTNVSFTEEVLNAAVRSTVNFYCFIHRYKLSALFFFLNHFIIFFYVFIKVHGLTRANKRCISPLVGCVAG